MLNVAYSIKTDVYKCYKIFNFKYENYLLGKNKGEISSSKGCVYMGKKTDKEKSALTSMQAVSYQRDFKMADRAAGFTDRKGRK